MYEHTVVSRWTGWFGGWGSESAAAQTLNWASADGWRLVRSESGVFFWFWLLPRHKILMFFERERQEPPTDWR